MPSYEGTVAPEYKTQKYYEEEINGIKVLRIRVPEFNKADKLSRACFACEAEGQCDWSSNKKNLKLT